ncbi:MAG: MerR family transcriptional regulator [Acidimicrobiales bacterium]
MTGLTIHEAAATTGWSARMLRYIEDSGLVVPTRSPGGYRLFGPAELQRLRTLRELLEEYGIELAEVGFALRLRSDRPLRSAIDAWLSAEAVRPAEVDPSEWLAFEQRKHVRLLAAAAVTSPYTKDTSPYTKDTSPYTKDTSPYTKDTSPYTKEME